MAKVFNTIEEVATAREAGRQVIFNLAAAIDALKATPLTAGHGAGGTKNTAFGLDVKMLFEEAAKNGVVKLNKIMLGNMYAAGHEMNIEGMAKSDASKYYKKFYEHCLAKSDHPAKKCAKPVYHYDQATVSFELIK